MDDITKKRVRQIIADMDHYRGGSTADTFQRPLMAQLLCIFAEEASNQSGRLESQINDLVGIAEAQKILAQRLERQTNKLIRLTWCIASLTFVLLCFTVYLSYDAYHKADGRDNAEPHTTQKP